MPTRWSASALGGLARLSGPPVTTVDYKLSEVAVYVSVTTNVSIEPLLKNSISGESAGIRGTN